MITHNDLPWQINLLIVETIVSMVVAMVLLDRRVTRLSPTGSFLMILWSAACVVLILWGGSLTWQHAIILVAESWSVFKGVQRLHNGGWSYASEETRRHVRANGLTASGAFMCAFFSVGIVMLLVTGSN